MKRLLMTALLVSLLGACTGSFEAANPVLLVVGYSSGGEGRVALIKDRFNEDGTVTEQLEFLPSSVKGLPARPVAYDVTNRERARGTLVVLSREAVGGGSATGYLTFFSLQNIDPDNPTAFRQTAEFTISPETVSVVRPIPNLQFCPVSVQVTQTGAFAAVFNEPSVCGGQGQPSIDLFEFRGAQLQLLQRLTTGGADDGGVGGGSFLAAGGDLYLSQSPTEDLLYYAVDATGGLRLEQATLPRPGTFRPDDELPIRTVARVRTNPVQGDLVDLGRAGTSADERLVLLFEAALASVDVVAEDAEDEVVPVETEPDNAFVVRDDRRDTDATLFVSTPAARRFSYAPVVTDEAATEIENARVAAVDAVVGPTGFVYFVAPGQVAIFDLSSYDVGENLRNPRAVSVPQLTDPSFITWAQSSPPVTP